MTLIHSVLKIITHTFFAQIETENPFQVIILNQRRSDQSNTHPPYKHIQVHLFFDILGWRQDSQHFLFD